MSGNTDNEVATLIAFMPWLKREEALQLLESYGGSAESVMEFLNKASPGDSSLSQSQQKNQQRAKTDKKKMEKHFVGGGPSSGQVVLAGGDDNDTITNDTNNAVENLIESIFDRARQQQQQQKEKKKKTNNNNNSNNSNSDGSDSDSGSTPVHAFFGAGRRLGHTTAPSPAIAPTLRQQREITVTVYKNSFKVDEGPTQRKDTPAGAAFFAALHAGRVPEGVASLYPNTNISVRLVDLTMHEAPTGFAAFTGEGRRLTNSTTTTNNNNSSSTSSMDVRSGKFELHEGEETTRLAIVNLLGERKEFTVNPMRHTVQDLFILASQHAQPGAVSFQLIARDIPPRPLKDMSQTIDEAKLRNATVMMRHK